ncbi:MAG TPA: hypothetical protein VGH11_12765 [Jatrophihabitans sp.]
MPRSIVLHRFLGEEQSAGAICRLVRPPAMKSSTRRARHDRAEQRVTYAQSVLDAGIDPADEKQHGADDMTRGAGAQTDPDQGVAARPVLPQVVINSGLWAFEGRLRWSGSRLFT